MFLFVLFFFSYKIRIRKNSLNTEETKSQKMVKLLEKANDVRPSKSYLLLQDGTLFEGVSFGAQTPSDGEIGKFCLLFICYS
jgi:hypothetical protein